MSFIDDIDDKFPEVTREPDREVLELELRDADARVVRTLAVRLGLRPAAVVRLALAALARRARAAE